MTTEAIQERIKPVGEVNINTGEQAEVVLLPVAERVIEDIDMHESQVNEDGKVTYDQYCTLCHSNGVAGAPKFKDESDWQVRREEGIDVLMEHATQGYNMMPPMGTCSTCSQEQLKAAIEYMLPV